MRPRTPLDESELRRLWRAGLSDRAIARELGVPHWCIHGARRRLGLAANAYRHPPEVRARIGQANRTMHADPDIRARILGGLRRGREARWPGPPLPPYGTPERRRYIKLRAIIGRDAALRAIGRPAE